ncbi:MAG: GHKL domain-containing protein [Oscillospiraceae bacterium]|nr:GHKL domain-containing protein [Oscillospiraceae bacterium]
MIDKALFLRYMLDVLLVIPAGIISFLPIYKSMKNHSLFTIFSMFFVTLSVAVIAALVCARYQLYARYVMLPFYPIFFTLYSLLIPRSFAKKLFCFLNAVVLGSFCVMYSGYIMAPVERYNTDPVRTKDTEIVCLVMSFAAALIYKLTVSDEISELLDDDRLNPIWGWFTLIPAVFSIVIFISSPTNFDAVMGGRIQMIALIASLLIPLVVLVSYHMIWIISNRLRNYTQLQQENSLLKLEEKRYGQLRDFVDSSRAVRHDFRQHILAISRLAKAGDTEKLNEYLSPLVKSATETNTQYCLNMTVDAVAAHYDSIAVSQQTEVDWSLLLPRELPIHDSDVCSILGNFVENALNAVKKLPVSQRTVTVAASMLTDQTLGISVKNPFQGEVKFRKNGLPRNTKVGHGIGLQSVATIAEHYHGSLSLSAEGGVFSAGVLLYTNQEEK